MNQEELLSAIENYANGYGVKRGLEMSMVRSQSLAFIDGMILWSKDRNEVFIRPPKVEANLSTLEGGENE